MKQINLIHLIFPLLLFSCSKTPSSSALTLDLNDKGLSTIPDSVFAKTNLTQLNLGTSWISLSNYQKITDSLMSNHLTLLSNDIYKLKRLKYISLQKNDLSYLPSCFASLDQLEILDLSFNKHFRVLEAVPIFLKLKKLKELNLYGIDEAISDSLIIRENLKSKSLILTLTVKDFFKNYGRK